MPDITTTARPTYGNWRLPSRPGIGRLGLLGTILLLGGLIVTLLTALISWIAAIAVGLLITAVTVPLAIRTADGRSGFTILTARIGWARRRILGDGTYMSGPLSREPSGSFTLPGLLARAEMLEGRDVYHRPFGVIHDKTAGTSTVALECDPDGGALVDPEQVDTWVAGWDGWLAGLAHEPGLAGATVIVETAPDPGTRLAAEVLPRLDPAAPESARAIMAEVVASYPAASSQTSTYVTVTYRPAGEGGARFASRRDRLADMMTNLAIRISPLAAGLTAAGGGAVQPMPAERTADTIRTAFDPSVAATVLRARAKPGRPVCAGKTPGPRPRWRRPMPISTKGRCPGPGSRARHRAGRCGQVCCARCWNRHRGFSGSGSRCCTVRWIQPRPHAWWNPTGAARISWLLQPPAWSTPARRPRYGPLSRPPLRKPPGRAWWSSLWSSPLPPRMRPACG